MAEHKRQVAVFPGTFDPITNGHLDVIVRGARLFDELIVAVGDNPQKSSLLPMERRVETVRRAVAGLPNVRVASYTGLTVDFARSLGAATILRGIRNSADLDFESQVAMTNRAVAGVETVFILTSPSCAFISSSLIRQIARMGADISSLVPPQAAEAVYRAVGGRRRPSRVRAGKKPEGKRRAKGARRRR